ncbi:MAG: hypothetical protein KAI47_05010 [Deltaproteobacteria bacterium]|nr:hypothetical protein [Deltaproteobacteria bacterium]
MTTKISSISPTQISALDEEGQIAVTIQNQAQKESAAARKDRRSARRDEISQIRKKASELRRAANDMRGQAMWSIVGGVGSIVSLAGAPGKMMGTIMQAEATIGAGIQSLIHNDKNTQAALAMISIGEKGATQRVENAQEDMQHSAKSAESAKNLMEKIAEARVRNMQIATRN